MAKYLTFGAWQRFFHFFKIEKTRLFHGTGNANICLTDFLTGDCLKKLLCFLTLMALLALPLACQNRAFNEPVSPIVASTPTPTPVWSYQAGVFSTKLTP
jgi:hypothetical protein